MRISEGPSGRSSFSAKFLPSWGTTPSMGMKFAVTPAETMRTGSPEPVRLRFAHQYPESSVKDFIECRAATKSGDTRTSIWNLGLWPVTETSRPGAAYGRGRSSSEYTAEKIEVVAPIQSPSEITAVHV